MELLYYESAFGTTSKRVTCFKSQMLNSFKILEENRNGAQNFKLSNIHRKSGGPIGMIVDERVIRLTFGMSY